MIQDYQQKYQHLQRLYKKQQDVISKLKLQIRQRCHSYLLHASRFKKGESDKVDQSNPSTNLSESMAQKQNRQSEETEKQSMSLLDAETSCNEDELKLVKLQKLKIMREVDQKLIGQAIKVDENRKTIQLFKQRIATLQNSKNQYVKQVDKTNTQLKQIQRKHSEMQRELEIIAKSQKKLKQKLKRIPEYQAKIDEIYAKLKLEKRIIQANDINNNQQKNFNEKISIIIQWILQSQLKMDNIIDNANRQAGQISLTQSVEDRLIASQLFSTTKKIEPTSTQNWTIINRLNSIEIKPMQTSQVKQFQANHLVSQFETPKQDERIQKKLYQESKQLDEMKSQIQRLKEQLDKSRKLIISLQQSKVLNQTLPLKSQIDKSKAYINYEAQNSKVEIVQQLQPPYYVEEELENNDNNQYVKRSFIRKKIVKRNLSATAYRVISKSKQQIDTIVKNTLHQMTDRSREKVERSKVNEKLTRQAKLQNLKNSVRENRVSEVSEPRDSGIEQRYEQVKIIELTTTTPNEEIKTTKIYSKGGQSSSSTRRKF